MDASQKLLAIEDIRRLKARNLNVCDLKDPEVLLDCFWPGEIQISYGHVGEFETREDFVALFLSAAGQEDILDIYQGGNAEIEVVTGNFARARSNIDYRNINIREQTIMLARGLYDDGYFLC